MNVRYPSITGKDSAEQLKQIKTYLFQLAEQLNMESGNDGGERISSLPTSARNGKSGGSLAESTERAAGTPMSTFNQIKSLIIKSAEIVDAFYEEINEKLKGEYVAESEFGTYKVTTASELIKTSEKVEEAYDRVTEITGQLNEVINTKANIRSGLLFVVGEGVLEEELGQKELVDGTEVYGVEVGQTTTVMVDGQEVEKFNKFARFTAYGITLYDNNGNLSAYITDSRLNIPNAVVKNSLTRGGFVETINADGSCVERWVGV